MTYLPLTVTQSFSRNDLLIESMYHVEQDVHRELYVSIDRKSMYVVRQ
jgi:hypothetical protein